jgi:hypothetical protein
MSLPAHPWVELGMSALRLEAAFHAILLPQNGCSAWPCLHLALSEFFEWVANVMKRRFVPSWANSSDALPRSAFVTPITEK